MYRRAASSIAIFVLITGMIFNGCSSPMGPGREEKTWIPPIYSSASDDEGTSVGISALLNMIKHDRTPEKTYTHVFPFYFHESSEEYGGFTLIPPFYYERERAFEEDLFFLLWGAQKRGNRHDLHLLWPFIRYSYYEQQEQRWNIGAFPLFQAWRDGTRKQVKLLDIGLLHLLNLEWGVPGRTAETPRGSALSFVNLLNMVRLVGYSDLGGYKDFHLLTLFSAEKLSLYQRHWNKEVEGDGRTVLFPLYWHWKNEESEGLHLWPLYGWDKDVDGPRSSHFLYPLFTYSEDDKRNAWSLDCPWPLVRFMRSEEGDEETRLLPFYLDYQKGGESLTTVFPFYADYHDGQGYERQFYTPLFSRSQGPGQDDWSVDPLYPLLSFQQTKERSHQRFFPFYYRDITEESSLLEITPLFWRYRNADDYAYDLLFPFFSYEQDKDIEKWRFLLWFFGFDKAGDRKTFTFLWFIPISWGDDEPSDTREG